jgi:hypothetical protein
VGAQILLRQRIATAERHLRIYCKELGHQKKN